MKKCFNSKGLEQEEEFVENEVSEEEKLTYFGGES